VTRKKAYLIDGSGYIFRAFHAVPPLSNQAGFPTNALYGFQKMILKFLTDNAPEYCGVAFDVARETFRTALSPEYKAHRSECPAELVPQMPYFRELCSAMGLPIFEVPDFEADDVLGTLARRLSDEDVDVVLVTGDKDFMQLVNDKITLYDSMKGKISSFGEVHERFGVLPCLVPDVLALSGDASDNIIGLQGVGDKTAAQLIQNFGCLEDLLNRADEVITCSAIRNRVKIAAQIKEKREALILNKRLTTIHCEVPLSLKEGISKDDNDRWSKTVQRYPPLTSDLERLSQFLDFPNLVRDCSGIVVPVSQREASQRSFHVEVVSAERFPEFVARLIEQPRFAFDLETTSLDPHEASIVGASFCWSEREAWYVPCGHKGTDGITLEGQISSSELLTSLKALLESPHKEKWGQNCKFDISILLHHGIYVSGFTFDSMIAAYLLHPDRRGYSLDALARHYCSYSAQSFKDVTSRVSSFAEVPLSEAARYAGEDAWLVWLLYQELSPQIVESGLEKVFYSIEMPLIPVLAAMEYYGIALDRNVFDTLTVECRRSLALTEEAISKELHTVVNLNSPKQVAHLLFEVLKLPTKGIKKTKNGYSTDASSLEILAPYHSIPRLLLEYRINQKLLTTYLEPLPSLVSSRTGRLHTRFNQTATGTGRLSSSDPNLQNIPVSTSFGQRIRKGFVASPLKTLVIADYSQIELRILAHLSEDPRLIEAFETGVDIHAQTARQILNIPAEQDVTYSDRRIGKTINFGVVYGMGAFRLSHELQVPFDVAQTYINSYFDRFSGVRSYFDRVRQEAEFRGDSRTLFGRRRVLQDIAQESRDKSFLARVAINAPVQGTAADIVKLAMIRIYQRVRDCDMLLQIHDEVVVECATEDVERVTLLVRESMESVVSLRVPLTVEVSSGLHWGDK
jgi:DNA polymerase I